MAAVHCTELRGCPLYRLLAEEAAAAASEAALKDFADRSDKDYPGTSDTVLPWDQWDTVLP